MDTKIIFHGSFPKKNAKEYQLTAAIFAYFAPASVNKFYQQQTPTLLNKVPFAF